MTKPIPKKTLSISKIHAVFNRINKVVYFLIIILFSGILLTFYTVNNNTSTGDQKILVSTSIYPYYFFTKEIVGARIDVFNITPSGTEPHSYEPTSADLAKMSKSKFIIMNGSMEPWSKKIGSILPNKDILLMEEAGLSKYPSNKTPKTRIDPHTWLSPTLAREQVELIYSKLIQTLPEYKQYFEENKNSLLKKLEILDLEFRSGLQNCSSNKIITSHAAFGHLAKEYGLEEISISGISPDEEPTLMQLAKLSETAKANNIKYIFFETLVSPKLADTLAREVGAGTLVLNPLEGLSDEEISLGKTYLTEMRSNLHNLRVALGCR